MKSTRRQHSQLLLQVNALYKLLHVNTKYEDILSTPKIGPFFPLLFFTRSNEFYSYSHYFCVYIPFSFFFQRYTTMVCLEDGMCISVSNDSSVHVLRLCQLSPFLETVHHIGERETGTSRLRRHLSNLRSAQLSLDHCLPNHSHSQGLPAQFHLHLPLRHQSQTARSPYWWDHLNHEMPSTVIQGVPPMMK